MTTRRVATVEQSALPNLISFPMLPQMANTFTSLHYHLIFSTKNREPWLRPDVEQRVWSYLGGIVRENDGKPVMIGGIDNHVHLLLGLPPSLSVVRRTRPRRQPSRAEGSKTSIVMPTTASLWVAR